MLLWMKASLDEYNIRNVLRLLSLFFGLANVNIA